MASSNSPAASWFPSVLRILALLAQVFLYALLGQLVVPGSPVGISLLSLYPSVSNFLCSLLCLFWRWWPVPAVLFQPAPFAGHP